MAWRFLDRVLWKAQGWMRLALFLGAGTWQHEGPRRLTLGAHLGSPRLCQAQGAAFLSHRSGPRGRPGAEGQVGHLVLISLPPRSLALFFGGKSKASLGIIGVWDLTERGQGWLLVLCRTNFATSPVRLRARSASVWHPLHHRET